MRRIDKIKNMEKANLMLESRYVTLKENLPKCPPNTKWSEELQRCTKIKGTEDIGKNIDQIVREICKKINNPSILKAYKTITKNKNLDAYFERLKSVCVRQDVTDVKKEARNFLQQVYHESPTSVAQQFQGETGRFDMLLRKLTNFKEPNKSIQKPGTQETPTFNATFDDKTAKIARDNWEKDFNKKES